MHKETDEVWLSIELVSVVALVEIHLEHGADVELPCTSQVVQS